MSKISRRNFIKVGVNSVAALSVLGVANTSFANDKKALRVVIAGGGYGGATAAKYLKLLDPSIDVTLIDRFKDHVSCALSNEVIFGLRNKKEITKNLPALAKKYGFKFVSANVLSLDKDKKVLKTSSGEFAYDKLIVSPGIDMDVDPNLKLSEDVINTKIPHSWIAGKQTDLLMSQVKGVKKGDLIVFRAPKAPYRCPPGPYERGCLFAEYAKKVGAKVLFLDPNPTIVSKKPLFEKAFKEDYKDVLTYVTNAEVSAVKEDKTITYKGDGIKETTVKPKVLNYVHNNKAAKMAFDLGLVKEGAKWCAIDASSYKSLLAKDVYVIGDAIDPSVSAAPKSGTVANGTAKFVVENIVREHKGLAPKTPLYGNTCYSLVNSTEAIWIATIYEYNAKSKKIEIRNEANGIPKTASVENKLNGHSWGNNILADSFE